MLYQKPAMSELRALVSLLDDPDQIVQEAIHLRFQELGRRAIPALQEVHKKKHGHERDRIGKLMQELHFNEIEQHWKQIMQMPDAELEHGAFLLALHRFPGLNVRSFQDQLDDMAMFIKPRIDAAAGIGKAFVLSSFLCNELGFRGNNEHFSDPNNSYINCVLESRRGIPVTLCTIFILLGKRLNLPIYGVNMPAHFLAKYKDETHEVFFDIFNGGNPIMKEQCIQFLIKAGIKPQSKYFQAASSQTILLRMICNLLAVSQTRKKSRFVQELGILIEPWKNNSNIS